MSKKPLRIKAIFFDLGGVVIQGPPTNTTSAIAHACSPWIPPTEEVFIDACIHAMCRGTLNARGAIRQISEKFNIPTKGRRLVRGMLSSAWYARTMRVDTKVRQLVRSLLRRYIVGIISDTIPIHTVINRKRGVFKLFRPVVLSHAVHACKPEPAIFRVALRKSGVRPAKAIFIDDRPVKLAGAIRLGMHGIHFKNIVQLKRDLKKFGVAI